MTSMTGHGRGEARTKTWTAVVECFSVNRKTAEVVFHSERGASWLEPVVRERALARVARGRVQVNLALSHAEGASGGILDSARAAVFLQEARALQKKLRLAGEISISDVLSAPGVVRSIEPSGKGVKETVVAALDRALDGLAATRRREGGALQAVLERAIKHLGGIAKKISPLAKRVTLQQRESLLRRVARAGLGISGDDPRLLTEVVLLAERGDITEELDRAASHIAQFREKLAAEGPVGRTLEFLAQELGREFNTIGSKSSDADLARLIIDAKAELDRIREQLANIE
ncbi:MAG: YicC/YloC family endoribonuclease [Terrimicrobiaceae bacterium]|nr:YicC family protein [Terrimicrobiaceae bacterium]